MPGRGTEPGPQLYPECGTGAGVRQHKREGTPTCAACREHNRREMARYRVRRIITGPRQVPALGVHRRVHALARMGWGQDQIADRMGMDRTRFKKVMGYQETNRELAARVAAVYRELVGLPGPNWLARKNAERRGWPDPMDWEDIDDPREVPWSQSVEVALARRVEEAHWEALVMHQAWRHNQRKREQRALARARQQRHRAQQRELVTA